MTYVRGKDHHWYKHGLCGTKIRTIWSSMMQRCYNRNAVAYSDYGGRGIKVAHRWHNLESFVADVGKPPSPLHTLDRIDNDGDYRPGNWRWATRQQQAENRRNTVLLTFEGKTMCLTAWAREKGMGLHCLWLRIYRRGWSVERALSEPVWRHPR